MAAPGPDSSRTRRAQAIKHGCSRRAETRVPHCRRLNDNMSCTVHCHRRTPARATRPIFHASRRSNASPRAPQTLCRFAATQCSGADGVPGLGLISPNTALKYTSPCPRATRLGGHQDRQTCSTCLSRPDIGLQALLTIPAVSLFPHFRLLPTSREITWQPSSRLNPPSAKALARAHLSLCGNGRRPSTPTWRAS